ncbi:ribonuclease E inhibitor RraB [Fodinibius sp. SL11]|uniref:ribonuclease E inhibitor RraB n=1 Tax=Fodinibius sp. SL11 TaxID=3425690 RepID=UPI003F8811C2
MSRKQADQRVINEIETPDTDPEVEQSMEFFMYFPTEWDAYVTKSCLMNLQFDTSVHYSESSDNWLCVANKQIKPTSDRLLELKNFFERLAAGNNGRYDGWGTTVVEDEAGVT